MSEDKKVIVVVDDINDWRETIFAILSTAQYSPKTFDGLEAASKFINHNPFDLAIIDIRLDETDEDDTSGLDLARIIRAKNRQVPIIIITGYEVLKTVEEALKPDESGSRLASRYILKKNISPELLKVVEETLA